MKNTHYPTKLGALLLLSALLATGCGTANTAATATDSTSAVEVANASATSDAAAVELASLKADELVTYDEDDTNAAWSADSATQITLNGSGASVNGTGAAANGSTVTISAAGTYVLSGKLNGSVVIDAGKDDLVHLVLNGAEISNASGSAIHSKQADKTIVTLAEGTDNLLSDGTTYATQATDEEDAPTAALFSQDSLTINGTGKLTVKGNSKDGITSKDDLKIVSGTLNITAADDGIVGRDLAAFKDGSITVEAGGDGIKTTNTDTDKGYLVVQGGNFQISAVNDGLQAENSLLTTGGEFDIVTGGGSAKAEKKQESDSMQRKGFGMQSQTQGDSTQSSTATTETAETTETTTESDSAKALKAGVNLYIQGGTFKLDAKDDAVHSNVNVGISGGELSIATGDDAVHAEKIVAISGGVIGITASVEGIEGADIQISGGEIDLVSSDDGINATEGSDSETTMTPPTGDMPQGQPTDVPQGQPADPAGTTDSSADPATQQQAGAMQGQGRMGGGGFGAAGNAKLTISGGTITVNANGDGLDANGSIEMSGGTVVVNGPTNSGNGALDYDGTFEQTGGTLIAAGSSGMAQAPSDTSSQRSVMMTFPSTLEAGTLVTLADSSGNPLVSFAPAKSFQTVVISTAELKSGETYTFYTGGTSSATPADGLYVGGKLTGGTKVVSFTLGESITYVNESGVTTGGGGGFGGGRGQMPGQGQGRRGQGGTQPPATGDQGTSSTETSDTQVTG